MRIQTNIPGLIAYDRYRRTNTKMSKTLEKLSSGLRINRASDDASGLAISEKMRFKTTELDRCRQNVAEGVNIVKTADAALDEVNDMLIRAYQLCGEAANGTYGEQELDAVGDELNALFTEIDRITAGSNFNKIPLFRNAVPASHLERREVFDPLPAGQIETWGGIDLIQGKMDFEEGEKAKGAEAVFTLKDDVDPNDKMSLDGKAVTIDYGGKKYVYLFDGGSYGNLSYSGNYTFKVNLNSAGINSVEDALKQMAKATFRDEYNRPLENIIGEVTLNTKEVTLTAKPGDYITTLSVDGASQIFSVKDGDGTKYQNAAVSGPNGTLSFDKLTLGGPAYAATATATFDFSFLPSSISGDTFNNLKQNTLHIGNKTIALKDVVGNGTSITSTTFLNNLVTEIKNLGYTAARSGSSITITATGLTSPATIYVYETTAGTSGGTGDDWKTVLSGTSISAGKTQDGGGERGAIYKLDLSNIPQSGDTKAISFKINGKTYLLYDQDLDAKLKADNPDYSDGIRRNASVIKDINGMTQEQVRAYIIAEIKNNYKESAGYKYDVIGNTVTIQEPRGVSINPVEGYTATVELKKKGTPGTGGSNHVLYNGTAQGVGYASYSPKYLKQDAAYTISGLSDAAAIKALAGKSFQLKNPDSGITRGVVFYNSADKTVTAPSGYNLIDVKNISSANDLCTALNNTGLKTSAGFEATSYGGTVTLTLSKNTNGGSVSASSGYHEATSIVADTSPVKFDGGTIAGHDHTSIDFSSITDDNLEDLLGKGFRVNCATCSGEYVNVVFCWENEGNRMPESFQVFDEASNEMRTIHNVAVELSKVKNASSIVQDIVNQVESQLKHYTALSVDEDNPAVLIAQDRRPGSVYDDEKQTHRVYGSVEGGLKTNFTYSVADVDVRDFPPDGSVYLQDGGVDIYVGSDPNPSLIHLHLPYIDLEALRLGKPGEVDLNNPEQSASDWMGRIDTANNAISKARGMLGADQNRLEHTANALACEDENLTSAESRIRDADIAELMMNYTKLQILIQSQQSMLAQANQQPQSVLQLLG